MKLPTILTSRKSCATSTVFCHVERLGLDRRRKAALHRIFLAAMFMASMSACQQHDEPYQNKKQNVSTESITSTNLPLPINTLPTVQESFEQLRTSLRPEYEMAKNEIQKSTIFNSANSNVDVFLSANGINVKNWNGKIKNLRTSHGGDDAWLEILSSGGVSYRMSGINASSSVYRQLSSLSEGQRVIFSGSFQRSANGSWEASLTEIGSLQAPEYLISFTAVKSSPSDLPPSSIEKEKLITSAAKSAQLQMKNVAEKLDSVPPEVLQLNPAEVAMRTARTPQDNGPQGACNLLTASLTLVAVEREHGVPLANSKRNVAKILENMEVDEHDLNNWQEAATAIHASSVSAGELEQVLRKQCKQLPQQ